MVPSTIQKSLYTVRKTDQKKQRCVRDDLVLLADTEASSDETCGGGSKQRMHSAS